MTDKLKYLRNITKDFEEVKTLIEEHNVLKKKIRNVDRKLKTVETKYEFLSDIVSIGGHDTIIESAAKKLFKNIGFSDVRHLVKARPKREDLQVWCDDCIIIVECKGTKSEHPPNDEIGAVKKYVEYRKSKLQSLLPIFGLTIINHDNRKHFQKRILNPLDTYKIEYVIAQQFSVILTTELVKGFLLVKNNIISFEQFKNKIKQHGLITF
jgi:hypothetical protein